MDSRQDGGRHTTSIPLRRVGLLARRSTVGDSPPEWNVWRATVAESKAIRALADFLAITIVVLWTVVQMGPSLLQINRRLYGIGRDGIGAPAMVAKILGSSASPGPHGAASSLLGAPFYLQSPGEQADLLWWNAAALFARLFSPVGAINVMIFLGFVVTGLVLYVFLRRLRVPPPAAAIGTLLYTFCPIRLAEAQEHPLLLDGFWLVIECWLLLKIVRHGHAKWALLLGVCLALAELDNPYIGYFNGTVAVFWFLLFVVTAAWHRDRIRVQLLTSRAIFALLVLFLIVVPLQWSVLSGSDVPTGAYSSASSLDRSLGDVDRLSLRWWDFLLPFPENPILGPLAHSIFYSHLGVDTVTEQSTMTGYVALVLAISGLICILCYKVIAPMSTETGPYSGTPGERASNHYGSRLSERPNLDLFALAITCIGSGVLFGLPPEFRLGPVLIPTPPYFVHAVLPEIRTTSRFDLVIQFGVAILGAIGASALLSKVRFFGRRAILASVLAVSILLEYTNVPPWRYVQLLPAPAIYHWLALLSPRQAGIVAQYPIEASDLARAPLYAFYAYDVHHHPLFNGVLLGTPPDALRRNLLDILNPTNPAAWAALGIRTVTVDTVYYQQAFHNIGLEWAGEDGGFSRDIPSGLVVRYADSQAKGYTVTAGSAAVVVGLGEGFGDGNLGKDGREWQWIGRQATVWLDNVTTSPVRIVVWTMAHNNATAHTVKAPGYEPVPISLAQQESAVALPMVAQPGIHSAMLATAGLEQPLQGSGNAAPVSVQMRSLEPAPVRSLDAEFVEDGRGRWQLTGMSADACTLQPGTSFDIALLWTVMAPTAQNETVYLHLINADGTVVASGDGVPDNGTAATSEVASGTMISDVHSVRLPSTLPSGVYRLVAGLYDRLTNGRLLLTSGADGIDVGTVKIVAPGTGPERVPCGW